MNNLIVKKPCVVETPQGFSVSYKDRLLYSKYNPSKLIIDKINSLEIIPGTIFICISPGLCYGLSQLVNKLPENCLIYLCDFDRELEIFAKESDLYKQFITENQEKVNKLVFFPSEKELYNLPIELFNIAKSGKYKRVIRIDFSTGFQFTPELYNKFEDACVNSIRTFWTNRLTLTKFGRKYSHNFYTNLANLKKTTPINCYFNRISKPILIIGAGESVDKLFSENEYIPGKYFILCVDTILSSLISRNIIPQGVFVEEAQSVISKAFICNKYNVQLFSGLSSLPLISQYFNWENISYFTTEYTQATFIDKLSTEGLLPNINPPFGSVGLTAVYYGLKFRKDDSIPVFIMGLDFSYSVGPTHGKGTLAHTTRLLNTNKIIPIENYGAAFSPASIAFIDKSGRKFITTPTLKGYCALFNNLFSKVKNLFDISDCGMQLDITNIKIKTENSINNNLPTTNNFSSITKTKFSEEIITKLDNYLTKEIKELKYLRDLLRGEIILPQEELKEEIIKTATCKEYLYLHFPDGYCFNYNQSFLNRIRTEIDFFLKIFNQ